MAENRAEATAYHGKLEELSLLFEISQILDQSMDLKQVIQPVLKAVTAHLGMLRGTITLLNRNTGDIFIEAAFGLSNSQRERGRYKLGEGVTGSVVQSGQPRIISRISDDPSFLNRTGARKGQDTRDISFVCVPIKIGAETIGAFSVDRPFAEDTQLQDDVRVLSIVSSLIAQAVKIRQGIMEEKRVLQEENARLKEELRERFKPSNIIGNSKPMQAVFDLIAQVSKSDATVLVRGESGTGKELVAQAIHYNSHRSTKPFIKVNCAALPETVIESELFGHEKGSFTGAISTRKGRFEIAAGGTIFLDEIGDLSPTTQIKLLRVLQEREFERVGGNETIRTNVRVIAATNRNLERLMETNQFREDLYYRLNVFPIHVPPLRDRKSDILLLADYFIEKYAERNHVGIRRISTPAIDLLVNYHWPGNVRELENCIERAVLLSVDDVIHSHHLPPSLQSAESTGTQINGTLQESLDNLERELLMDALKSTKGNMAKAARLLDVTERVMGLRVKRHGVDPRHFRT
ncbi:MAG: nif-specific transcriptional activator NifA [Spirochaetaceae bacterium]|nr:MAG: nif-specific transcriptional activator NifA [Spirochaetaceae bacterium]